MTTVREALDRATAQLATVDSPRLTAEVLLAHTLGVSRAALFARPERVLTPAEESYFWGTVARRLAGEPLAYLVGEREFYGLAFRVDRRVLIPRPETELLVEEALRLAADRWPDQPFWAVDVGTGCGAIAVAFAVHCPRARVLAVDVSPAALAVARLNIVRHRVQDRVFPVASDLLMALAGPFDLVLANLPYVPSGDLPTLAPEVAVYEPRLALDGGPDGLDVYRRFFATLPERVRPGGAVLCEIGAGQGEAAAGLARRTFPEAAISVRSDWAGHDRLLCVRLPGPPA